MAECTSANFTARRFKKWIFFSKGGKDKQTRGQNRWFNHSGLSTPSIKMAFDRWAVGNGDFFFLKKQKKTSRFPLSQIFRRIFSSSGVFVRRKIWSKKKMTTTEGTELMKAVAMSAATRWRRVIKQTSLFQSEARSAQVVTRMNWCAAQHEPNSVKDRRCHFPLHYLYVPLMCPRKFPSLFSSSSSFYFIFLTKKRRRVFNIDRWFHFAVIMGKAVALADDELIQPDEISCGSIVVGRSSSAIRPRYCAQSTRYTTERSRRIGDEDSPSASPTSFTGVVKATWPLSAKTVIRCDAP